MKGISTILAMILIVIIVVALIGMTYTFAVGLFSTTANATQAQTNQITGNMGKTVNIASAKCTSVAGTGSYIFSLRNTGSSDITGGEISAFVDGSLLSISGGGFTGLTIGQIKEFTSIAMGISPATPHTLRISTPAGEIQTTVTC